jgi:hypothetical protein
MVEENPQQQTVELMKGLEMLELQGMDSGLLFLVLGLVSFELEEVLNINALNVKGEECSEDKGENDGTIDECAYSFQVKKVWMDSNGSGVESYGGLL